MLMCDWNCGYTQHYVAMLLRRGCILAMQNWKGMRSAVNECEVSGRRVLALVTFVQGSEASVYGGQLPAEC